MPTKMNTPDKIKSTFKDKIRERFSVVKQQSSDSLLKIKSNKTVQRKSNFQSHDLESCSNIFLPEEHQEVELNNAILNAKAEMKIKAISKQIRDKTQKQNDFFLLEEPKECKDFNKNIKDSPQLESDEIINEDKDPTKKLKSKINKTPLDYFDIEMNLSKKNITKSLIVHNTFEKKSDFLFWNGQTNSLNDLDKKRDPIEEGLYVGAKPILNKRSNHLKAIFSQCENASDWFDTNGELIMEGDPTKQMCNDLVYVKEKKMEILSIHKKPVLYNNVENLYKASGNDCISILEFHFGILKFDHHPLFSLEHILAQNLISSYNEYVKHQKEMRNNNLEELLISLRDRKMKLLQSASDARGSNPKKLFKNISVRKCIKEISEIRKSRTQELTKERELERKIVILWQDIKVTRKKIQDVNTHVQLEIKKISTDISEDRIKWESNFDNELTDMIDEWKCDYYESKTDYHDQNKKHKNKLYEKPSKSSLNCDEGAIRKILHSEMCQSFRQPGEPLISFCLKFSPALITIIPKSLSEIKRRADLDKTKFYIKILLNNREVCKTKKFKLDSDFKVNIDEKYSVKLSETAYSLKLLLFEQNSRLSSIQISDIFVPIPKQDISIANVEENINLFDVNLKRSFTHNGVGDSKSLSEVLQTKFSQISINQTNFNDILQGKGYITTKVGWEITTDKLQCFPSVEINLVDNIKYEKKYIKMLSSLYESNLDPNNPENTFILRILNDFNPDEFITDRFYFNEHLYFNFIDQNINTENRNAITEYKNKSQENINNAESEVASTSSMGLHDRRIRESILDKTSSVLNSMLDPVDLQRRTCSRYLQLVNDHLFLQSKANNNDKQLEDIVTVLKYPGLRSITMDILRPKRPLFHQSMHPTPTTTYQNSLTRDYTLRVCVLKAFQLPNRREAIQPTSADENDGGGLKVASLRPFVRISCQGKSQRTSTAVGNNPTWNEQLCLPIRCNFSSVISINLFDEIFEDILTDSRLENSTIHYQYSANWLACLKISLSNVYSQNKIEGTFLMYSPAELIGYKNNSEDRHSNSYVSYESLRKDIILKQRDGLFISLYLEIFPTYSDVSLFRYENFESNEMEFMLKYLDTFCDTYRNQFPRRKVNLMMLDTHGKSICVTRFLQPLPIPEFVECLRILFSNTTHEDSLSSKSSTPIRRKTPKSRSEKEDGGNRSVRSSLSVITGDMRRHSKVPKEIFEMKSLEGNLTDDSENGLTSRMQVSTRFVSLIPLFENHSIENQGVVLSGPQTLKLACGSMMDHSILLVNYFLYLGVDCWLVAGNGLPRGTSAYVLIKENMINNKIGLKDESSNITAKNKAIWKYCLYDATTGMKYDTKDPFCPLQKVHYVCNDENIWVNIQPVERCDLLKFNINKSSDWRPVFQKARIISCPGPLPGMLFATGSEDQLYSYNTQEAQRLKDVLEDKIKLKFQKWRGHRRTIWNRHCSSILKSTLINWEKWCIHPSTSKPKANHLLQQLLVSYQVYGFPFNTTYTTLSDVLASVKATQVHLHENLGIEFALGVEIFSYPNNIFSVWIYLATVNRK